jgi:hypothetical protein
MFFVDVFVKTIVTWAGGGGVGWLSDLQDCLMFCKYGTVCDYPLGCYMRFILSNILCTI